MDYIFLLLIMCSPILWLITFAITINQRYLVQSLIIHTLAFATYSVFIFYFTRHFIGTEELDIALLFLWLFFIVTHVVIGFIWALAMQYKKYTHVKTKS